MDDQDWTVVTVRSSKIRHANTPYSISGTATSSGVKTKMSGTTSELRKVADTEHGKPKVLSTDSRTALAAARVAKKLTQKELDAKCSFPQNSCSSWESGRMSPNSVQIQSLNRFLGVKLERH
jgi:ribosome-binding protein aMBF1 (putative translation factor)